MRIALLGALIVSGTAATAAAAQQPPSTSRPAVRATRPAPLPRPVIRFIGTETYEAQGATWVRYKYVLVNRDAFPAELWTAAPNLPPCGTNANASRGWLDIFSSSGQRLYGYCAATSANEFAVFGFQLQRGQTAPAQVYVTITDRATGQSVQSNSAPTSN